MSCHRSHWIYLDCNIAYRGARVGHLDLGQCTTGQSELRYSRYTSQPFLATRQGVHCNFPPRPDRLPRDDFFGPTRPVAGLTLSVELLITRPGDSDGAEFCIAKRAGLVRSGVLECVSSEICIGRRSGEAAVLQKDLSAGRPKMVSSNPSIISSIENND